MSSLKKNSSMTPQTNRAWKLPVHNSGFRHTINLPQYKGKYFIADQSFVLFKTNFLPSNRHEILEMVIVLIMHVSAQIFCKWSKMQTQTQLCMYHHTDMYTPSQDLHRVMHTPSKVYTDVVMYTPSQDLHRHSYVWTMRIYTDIVKCVLWGSTQT